jgi:DNA-binding CsgD family transcriptional regulator
MHRVSESGGRDVRSAIASPKLTPREAEVLFWISQGKSNYEIGVILGAKTGTICKHVGHVLSKLNVENRTAAAVVALENRRSGTQRFEEGSGKPYIALAGILAAQLGELLSSSCEIFDALSLAG